MNLIDQRAARNGAATGFPAAIGSLWTALIERVFIRAADKFAIALTELRKTNAIKDLLADTPGSSLLGVADAPGGLLTGTQTNNTSVSESASFLFAMPNEYVAGQPITVRVRAMVSANRFVAQQVDVVAKKMGDAGLGADICLTNPKTLITAMANYDFVISPLGVAPGDIIEVDVFLIANDTGGSTNGTATASAITMLVDTSA